MAGVLNRRATAQALLAAAEASGWCTAWTVESGFLDALERRVQRLIREAVAEHPHIGDAVKVLPGFLCGT